MSRINNGQPIEIMNAFYKETEKINTYHKYFQAS